MDRIPLLDLAVQHAPLADELRDAASRVLAGGAFILGPEVAAFEREIAVTLGATHAIGVSSGSDALVAMLLACGIGPGDEVVTTPYSFFATVEAVLRTGARPVFADVDPRTLNLDPALAAEAIGPHTRAVLVVHLFGRLARIEGLGAVCAGRGVALLADGAQAIGAHDPSATGARRGSGVGRATALSFFPSKNLGGFGDGGMVLTDDGEIASAVRRIRSHGADQKFRHLVVGGNYRLDELQAALLRVKLPHLDAWTNERRRLATEYQRRLEGLPLELPPPDERSVWNQYVIRVPAERREKLIRHLDDGGIASAVLYPVPLHLQPRSRRPATARELSRSQNAQRRKRLRCRSIPVSTVRRSTGSWMRLYPLTKVTNKHLLPVGREPMIFHCVRQMAGAGLSEILVVTSTEHMGEIVSALGSGQEFGVNLTYRVQEQALGIAHALALGETFSAGGPVAVLLGDNVFTEPLAPFVERFRAAPQGARVLLKRVTDAERYGVAALDEQQVVSIEEKPSSPKSDLAVIGFYQYDSSLFDVIRTVDPGPRGELEITAVNNAYLTRKRLSYDVYEGGWTDAGTFDSYLLANELMSGR